MRALLKGNIAFSANFFKVYVKKENPLTEVNGFWVGIDIRNGTGLKV